MSRFKDTLDQLHKRAMEDAQIKEVLTEIGGGPPFDPSEEAAPLRLPYSSDPVSIEEPWHY